ncbi:MAG: acyl-CoA dehydrogenase [Acidimicrobiales bacterium]|jgi:alkylation response protein AidB-like acyl-CoA dehydrogenase
MNLLPTPEQEELVAAAARLLAAGAPVDGPPAAAREAGLEARWAQMAGLGWFAIGVPTARGGSAGSTADQALLFRELGRALASGPLLGTSLGIAVALAGGRDDLAGSLMAGETTAGLAEPWHDASAAVAGQACLRGRFRVLEADGADYVTCLAPDGVALAPAAPVRAVARALPAPDPSVAVALADLEGVATEVALPAGERAARVASRGRLLAAALLVGVLEAVRDMSVTYALSREQFGKPIGAFQAVKHRCADMAVRAEAAGSLLWLAALSLDAQAPEAHRLAASAKALASEYAVVSAHDNVQNHGGMGFTEECAAHLYVKRALEWSVTLGSPDVLLAEVAR